jgi:hypothetical protein
LIYVPGLQMRWTTALLGVAILAVVTWRRRNPLLGVAAVVAWASLYEMLWVLLRQSPTGQAGGLPWQEYAWTLAVGTGWTVVVVLARAAPDPLWLVVSAAGFLVWALSGLHYNSYGQRGHFLVGSELLNVWSKTALGVAYLRGAARVPALDRQAGMTRSERVLCIVTAVRSRYT